MEKADYTSLEYSEAGAQSSSVNKKEGNIRDYNISNLRSPELRQRVNSEWELYKLNSKSSQTKAAKILNMNQSAFSQYLRGPENGGVPLNYTFIAKFAAMIGKTPDELGVRFKADVSAMPLEVRYTLSGRELTGVVSCSYMGVPAASCFGIEVDIPDWILRKGDIIIVDPEADIYDTGSVVVIADSGIRRGTIAFDERANEWEVHFPTAGGVEAIRVDEDTKVYREVGTYKPNPATKVFRR